MAGRGYGNQDVGPAGGRTGGTPQSPNQRGGQAAQNGQQQNDAAWDSVYAANVSQAPAYWQNTYDPSRDRLLQNNAQAQATMYGAGAQSAAAGLHYGGQSAGYGTAAGNMAAGYGTTAGNMAAGYGANAGQALNSYGAQALGYGLGQGQQLSNIGSQSANYGQSQALMAQNQAAGLGAAGRSIMGVGGGAYGQDVIGTERARLNALEATQGPSAAQAQLQSGLNQAQASNLALARSGSGFGGNAAAMQQAISQNAAMGQEASNQSAALRAQEDAAFRQRAAANAQAAGTLGLGQAQANASREAGLMGMGLQAQQQAAGLGLQAGQLGLQGLGQYGQLAGQGAAIGQNAYGQLGDMTAAGAGLGLQGILGGGQLGTQAITSGGQLGLSGLGQAGDLTMAGYGQQGQLAGQAGSLGLATEGQIQSGAQFGYNLAEAETARDLQIAGMQMGFNLQNASMANQVIGSAVGAAAGGAAMLSDVNAKEEIRPESVSMGTGASGAGAQRPVGPGGAAYDRAMAQQAAGERRANRPMGRVLTGPNSSGSSLSDIFGGALDQFGAGMRAGPGAMGYAMNPYVTSDERSKHVYSDERAKTQAAEMVGGLDPYSFEYKDPERHGHGRHYGIMAQDLERSPAGRSVVERGPDGMRRVNTPKLTMLNSAALASVDDRIGELERRISRLGGSAA